MNIKCEDKLSPRTFADLAYGDVFRIEGKNGTYIKTRAVPGDRTNIATDMIDGWAAVLPADCVVTCYPYATLHISTAK